MPSRIVERISNTTINNRLRIGINDGWPTSAAELNSAFGGYGTWASIWQCDDSSGNLTDSLGAANLVPGLTPNYRVAGPLSGDYAVSFDSGTADRFVASSSTVYDCAAGTSIAYYICIKPSSVVNRYFMGKGASKICALLMESSPSGRITAQIADGVNLAQSQIAANHNDGSWHDILFVLDRTNQLIQCFSDLGTATSASTASVGSLSSATLFHIGAVASSTVFGCSVAYAAVATGDIPNLRINGATAITNIRRATGR